jgi:hypothetical protein
MNSSGDLALHVHGLVCMEAHKPIAEKRSRRTISDSLRLVMSAVAIPPTSPLPRSGPLVLRAVRPAMNDLRFKGEAEVLPTDRGARLCLGRYELTRLECTPLDLPSLARLFHDLRIAEARRLLSRRAPRCPDNLG